VGIETGEAVFEAKVQAYFDSIRPAFEQTLRATATDYSKFVLWLAWLIGLIGITALPFSLAHVRNFVFHGNSVTLLGKNFDVQDSAFFVFIWCAMIGPVLLAGITRSLVRSAQFKRSKKPLTPPRMAFALSYVITSELEHFDRNRIDYHRTKATELWKKLLTYLALILTPERSEELSFHDLPAAEFSLMPRMMLIAKVLDWESLDKPAFEIISGLNQLHSKISRRLLDAVDRETLIEIFRRLSHYFYTWTPEHKNEEQLTFWGYSELQKCVTVLNSLPVLERTQKSRLRRARRFLAMCGASFTHPHVAVAFFAWWITFQVLFGILVFAAFRFFPNLSMNSQAMVALIGGPIAAAISMVGISRRNA